jgi:hypothetical protein
VYYKAKSEYRLRIKIWGGANRIPTILRKGERVTREFSWKEVGIRKKLIGNATIGEGGEIHKKEKRG